MPRPRKTGLAVYTRLEESDAEEFVRRCTDRKISPSELARELIHAALRAK